ncbi:DUF3108 domain-containing protein [Luteimonas sp. A478]
MKSAFLTAVALLLAGIVSQPAHAALTPFKADYSVRYHGIPASATTNLQRQGNNWIYLMSVGNAAASMNQATVFMERGELYIPLGGSDRVQYPGGARAVTTRWAWQDRQVRWTGDVKLTRAGPVELQRGDMDALLAQLALVRDHQARGATNYRILENGRARPANFRRSGTETITIAGEAVQATRYVQARTGKTTTIWVANDIPTPVRLTQQEGSREVVRMTLRSWTR